MNAMPDRDKAQELLTRANQLGAATTSGAGWPQLATLLGLGAISSMFVILMGTGASEAVFTPVMITMFIWLAILLATGIVFGRSAKTGFGRRWTTTIATWAILWVTAMLGGPLLFDGQFWFYVVIAALITIVTTAGAWIEARK